MQKTKSSKWMCSKVLYILPMATLALSAFATVQPTGRQSEDTDGKVKIIAAQQQANGEEKASSGLHSLSDEARRWFEQHPDMPSDTLVCATATIMPEFPGGDVLEYMQKTMHYPKVAQEWGVMGRVTVQFLVQKDGTISNVHPVSYNRIKSPDKATLIQKVVDDYVKDSKAKGKTISPEEKAGYRSGVAAIIDEAVRVVSLMPRWTPGYLDKEKTKPCNATYMLPLLFRLR